MTEFFNGVLSLGLGFARFLEREAGHTLTAICLIAIAVRISDPQTRAAAAHDLLVYSMGVLSRGMGSNQKGTA